jgi:hypothetical protein
MSVSFGSIQLRLERTSYIDFPAAPGAIPFRDLSNRRGGTEQLRSSRAGNNSPSY